MKKKDWLLCLIPIIGLHFSLKWAYWMNVLVVYLMAAYHALALLGIIIGWVLWNH